MRSIFPAAMTAVALVTGVAGAETIDVKPGLWEQTVTMQREGAPAMPDMSKLPPEQRAHIEQMMGAMSGKPVTSRDCITPAMIGKWESLAKDGTDDGCTRKVLESSGKHVRMDVSCNGGETTGTSELQAPTPERMDGTVHMVRRVDGAERATRITSSARWLASDCGSVKPE